MLWEEDQIFFVQAVSLEHIEAYLKACRNKDNELFLTVSVDDHLGMLELSFHFTMVSSTLHVSRNQISTESASLRPNIQPQGRWIFLYITDQFQKMRP